MAKEQPENVYWERIRIVMRFAGIATANAFALSIGLKRPETLYQIKSGKCGISRKLAGLIHAAYPVFGIAWLICGDALCDNSPSAAAGIYEIEKIPIYEDLLHREIADTNPASYLYLQPSIARGAQLATVYYDDLITGLFSCGAHLLLKKHVGEIVYGNIYLIDLKGDKLFRIIRSVPDDPKVLRLTTARPSLYDDMIVNRNAVVPLYVVCGTITNFCV